MKRPRIFPDSYGYKLTRTGHLFRVVRAGSPRSHPSRGGTWYSVEIYPGYRPSYLRGQGLRGVPGVGGKKLYRGIVRLHNPYFFEIPEVKAEGEIPIRLWEHVTGKRLTSYRGFYGRQAEKYYAKLEREIAEILSSQGFDGVVLYYQPGGPHTRYPSQLFVFSKNRLYNRPAWKH